MNQLDVYIQPLFFRFISNLGYHSGNLFRKDWHTLVLQTSRQRRIFYFSSCVLYYFLLWCWKNLHTYCLKTTQIYYLTVLEGGGLEWVSMGWNEDVGRAAFFLKDLLGSLFLYFFQLLEGTSFFGLWPHCPPLKSVMVRQAFFTSHLSDTDSPASLFHIIRILVITVGLLGQVTTISTSQGQGLLIS